MAMMTSTNAFDPLSINLAKQKRALRALLPPDSIHIHQITEANTTTHALLTLSRLLAVPALTLTIADLFRPILIDLCARWLHDDDNIEDKFIAFCLLIEFHEELYPCLYAFLQKPCLSKGPLAFIAAAPSIADIGIPRLHRILLAYYRLLRANRLLPKHLLWDASLLSKLLFPPHPDAGVRLFAARCYASHVGMAELEREKLITHVLGELCGVDCPINYGQTIDGTVVETDGWLVPTLEIKRIHDARDTILESPVFCSLEAEDVLQPLSEADLSPWIVNMHGLMMLKSSPTIPSPSNIIATPSAIAALREIAANLSLRLPVLLSSPPSSGKSLLISHLASNLHPTTPVNELIVIVHLADTSLDPRALLGSYVSSPTLLGTFEWKDGVLVRALREGRWLVLSDIDRASMEVLALLKPLVESMGLGNWIGHRAGIEVPGKGRVEAREGFALFATRSLAVGHGKKVPPPTFFGSHKWHEVMVSAPDAEEVRSIIESRFPKILGAAAPLIKLWADVQALGSTSSSRPVGLRELQKFCQRVERLLPSGYTVDMDMDNDTLLPLSNVFPNPSLREEIFLEARDVFFGAGTLTASARAHSAQVSSVIGVHLDLDAERQEWLLLRHTSDFEIEKDVNGDVLAARCGRTRLPARPMKGMSTGASSRPFALHKPALLLLSRISTALALSEPVLLTGETGTGKTSAVTYLASLLRRPLISLNLSHQTEASDLLGGFRPVDARVRGSELMEHWSELFGKTFSRKRNAGFEDGLRKAVREGRWKRAVGMWKESGKMARERIRGKVEGVIGENDPDAPRKRRKVEAEMKFSEADWERFEKDVVEFDLQHAQGKGKFTFDFVEGPLVKALRAGDWILLDEINLASPETLECITGLLRGPTASITLTEQGSLSAVPRHPDFRLFACMNPATDVGKKDLPPTIRARFTEIDVPPPDADRETLLSIVSQYIGSNAVGDKGAVMDIAEFYISAKGAELADGSNKKPHYSMRTLARALTFAADIAGMFGLRRALWEGMLMAFTMVLDGTSAETVTALAQKHILAGVRNPRSLLAREPNLPHGQSIEEFIKFGPFHLEKGPLPEDPMEEYIMTPSVEKKLIDLARIVLTRRFPVLIEGPTSAGKTSAVEYLARRTGHRFIRINNHEHTDVQEYLGSYVSDPATGKLVFKDGLLVHALRYGHWIVLDELNLAPTDVLEALNRLLDDNRELVVPETQEVVRPHPHFMLFATQNPPGLYAGRKVLSRAFRNRFLEVHFQDVPQAELETILCQRCRIAPSYGQKIVSVFRELQKRRQSGRVFESKQGFATLRDLFRWAGRDAVGYQELAENGYMLLAERARREDDKIVVKEVIESIMKVRIDERAIYDIHSTMEDVQSFLGCPIPLDSQVVWTSAMQRLFVLVSRALRFNEPVLLVGETGSGKTSVCQLFAEVISKHLYTLSCHQNTETADLIGGLRPVRNRASSEANIIRDANTILERAGIDDVPSDSQQLLSRIDTLLKSSKDLDPSLLIPLRDIQENLNRICCLFEWHDGPLVRAMRGGDVFLLDEISLADDSVLERLNSVLEPGRTIVLAERGGIDGDYPAIHASSEFKLLATMNPGGDYGKKELSPALRNRFTEIWVPAVTNQADLRLIIDHSWKHNSVKPFTDPLLQFTNWLRDRVCDPAICSLRDILAWVTFVNAACSGSAETSMLPAEIFHHAAHMTFLDGLGSLPQLASYSSDALSQLRNDALEKLQTLVPFKEAEQSYAFDASNFVQLGSFAIPKGPLGSVLHSFNLQAPTARENAMRVVRACQVSKPVLLEGSPGVGKTSLITTLAMLSGYQLCRINLSDQTDLMDLFGSDLPVENGSPGEFAWKDAEFLTAMQEGHWVLLDEMNLAPQAILEGLNAVLDHRGTVYIPELGRSFVRHPAFRVFAAQNPLQQGGGRKGLPKSFLDRFTKVYIEELSPEDLLFVCRERFRGCDEDMLRAMITYNSRLNQEVVHRRTFGRDGSPWEFNLRDVLRWGELLQSSPISHHPRDFLRVIYLSRFRTLADRNCAQQLFDQTFALPSPTILHNPHPVISSSHFRVGHYLVERRNNTLNVRPRRLLQAHLATLEAIGACLSRSWLVIVTGRHDSGKSELIRTVADLSGNILHEITITSSTDTMDILGGFEQMDHRTRVLALVQDIISFGESRSRCLSSCATDHQTFLPLLLGLYSAPPSSDSLLHSAAQVLSAFAVENSSDEAQDLLHRVRQLSSVMTSSGQFEWVDGPLVRAIKRGHWVVLDGANLCNPSVLDRLNSLCEPGGVLVLSERGYVNGAVQALKPHPNFRMFMTSDPRYGELSRAMRNRGIEVSLAASFSSEDELRLRLHRRLPRTVLGTGSSFAVTHELARRGIFYTTPGEGSDSWPSGLMEEESSTSSLITLAPFLRPSKPDLRAMINFTLRTISLNVIPSLRRYMKLARPSCISQSILDDTLSSGAFKLFAEWRKDLLASRVTNDAITALPVDAFMVCSPCKFCSHETSHHPIHLMLLQTLNLIAAIFIDDTERAEMPQELHSIGASKIILPTRQQHPTYSRLLDAIREVLGEVRRAAEEVFNQIVGSSQVQLVDLELALKLLSVSRQLRRSGAGTYVDYSSIQACSRSIIAALQSRSPAFDRLASISAVLDEAVSPTSGLGLTEMWTHLFAPTTIEVSVPEIRSLEYAAGQPYEGLNQHVRRKQILEVLSLCTLPLMSTVSTSLEMELANTVKEKVTSKFHGGNDSFKRHVDPSLLICELPWLSNIREASSSSSSSSSIVASIMKRLIDVACEEPREDLIRFASYQHFIWAYDAGGGVPTHLLTALQTRWLASLWNSCSTQVEILDGPDVLLCPTLLRASIELNKARSVSLSSLEGHEGAVRRHLRLLSMQCVVHEPRVQQLSAFMYQCMLSIASCFASSFDDISWQAMLGSPVHSSAFPMKMLSFLENSKHEPLRAAIQLFLRPTIIRFAADRQPQHIMVARLGHCYISLSRVILDLSIPDLPVDPAAVIRRLAEYSQEEADFLSTQSSLHRAWEHRTAGNLFNSVTQYLDALSDGEHKHVPLGSSNLPRRADGNRIHTFWSEVSQLQSQVIQSSKVDDLTALLETGDPSAFARESVMQESISGFCQRMDNLYRDFEDIAKIIQLALLLLRLGIRLVRCSAQQMSHAQHTQQNIVAASLVTYPSLRSAQLLQTQLEQGAASGASPSDQVLLHVSAIGLQATMSGLAPHAAAVHAAYEQAFRLWTMDRTRQSEKEHDDTSLYKRSALDHDASTEVEAEQKEFLELFPTFEDALASPDGIPNRIQEKPAEFFGVSAAEALLGMHFGLTGVACIGISVGGPSTRFQSSRRSVLKTLLDNRYPTLPDTLDDESLHEQLSLVHDHLLALKSQERPADQLFNFYTDANIKEAKKALIAVNSLRMRLIALVEDWPDQMVLQHLKDRCDAYLALDINSPIAKLLSGLEQIIQQTDEWEMYAHRGNSLRAYQQELTMLIVEWRRLELSCWKVLLQSQFDSFVKGVSEFWFRLYDLTVRGTLGAANEDEDAGTGALQHYLRQLPSLLDDFMQSSSLGQFQVRLDLLETFGVIVSHISSTLDGWQRNALQRVGRVLTSTRRYYRLFAVQLAGSLADQRGGLEKDVQAFIKLASWKDINVHALKQSAQRTHHQLYKLIRKFREILRQPITGRMLPTFAGDAECAQSIDALGYSGDLLSIACTLERGECPQPNETHSTPSHLANLNQTLARFRGLVNNRIRAFLRRRLPHHVDQLAVEIILTARDLSAEGVPPGLSKEKREKYVKGLLVRKKKALSDLLKELKRAGLAANVKPEVLAELRDECWIREQPSMPPESSIHVEKGEYYFDRLRGALPAVRVLLSDHHSDISTRDLLRGVTFVESGYSLALKGRSSLSKAFQCFVDIKRCAERLQTLVEAPLLVTKGFSPTHLMHLCQTLGNAVHAFEELLQGIRLFVEIQEDQGAAPSVMVEVQSVCVKTRLLYDRVSEVFRGSQCTMLMVLPGVEYATVQEADEHLRALPDYLQKMKTTEPRLSYILSPMEHWLRDQHASTDAEAASGTVEPLGADAIIETLLVTVQSLLKRCPEGSTDEHPDDEPQDNFISEDSRTVSGFTQAFDLEVLLERLNVMTTHLSSLPQSDIQASLRRLLPFLQFYIAFVGEHLMVHSQWTKALFKLDFIVCSVMHTIARQGFCLPQEATDSGDGEGGTETAGGVGLGEGMGTENVSKEIEDESQVEGLKGDEGEAPDEQEHGADDNTIEMSEDIGGEMEDVPDDGDQDGDQEEDDDDEQEGPDEQLGKLDAGDPDAVDEKLWGDESAESDPADQDQVPQDRSEMQEKESEVVAKERNQSKKEGGKEKEEKKDGTMDEQSGEVEEEGDENEGEAPDEDLEAPNANGAPMDEHIPDANTLDLPDDMNLEPDEQGDQGGLDMGDEMDTELDEDEQDADEMEETDQPGKDESPEDVPEPQSQENQLPDQPPHAADDADNVEEDVEEGAVARPDVSPGNGDSGDKDNEPQANDSAQQGQAGDASGEMKDDPAAAEQSTNETSEESKDDAEPSQPSSSTDTATKPGTSAEGTQHGGAYARQHTELATNPIRNLGDALKEVQQRFEEILGGGESSPPVADHVAEQVEYADADEEMQALGAAGEEQVAKLSELRIVDEQTEAVALPMDIDAPCPDELVPPPQSLASLHTEPTTEGSRPDIEGAITQLEARSGARPEHVSSRPDPSSAQADVDEDMEQPSPESSFENIEAALRTWQDSGYTCEAAESLWRLYTSLTHDLSYALCEQLRLILAPTLATRLKGDYRTGKRLNMKKIIPYIASDYTKDKIWLRRTRPSQREYQVLLALDDSRSMASSRSVHLAYQTLALVSNAMGKLEVGDIAIARFGEAMELLHGFDEGPFTDAAGAKTLGAFRFEQRATNVLDMVETSLGVLESARERRATGSASAGELWQLEIIISDGICQDHERLRQVLRRAASQRVMIVFIIIDSLHSTSTSGQGQTKDTPAVQNSIVSMNQVAYTMVNGRMELQVERYLDSFPFDYYVVLRSVEALPEVLSDTLRQFFERISEE
ncbi:P-loop containing nucleoside triphosphate hydrolase protein [Suillus clintonianus]|uniref:P-loop containing nucleoside triphosphate hydrolase protein n=1 Tax=Suillus clintonianus TaxID=1904413 RepID=UPI001B8685A7|nr:P-loop containing nucleoside triphosphate hydrolase protein [Suillus clintonianus]KAG2151443.1 P-loop containing nucleoside triphosphate hydrolase protein [Suillus clintonianus]